MAPRSHHLHTLTQLNTMQTLGKLTNHHLAISDSEKDNIVNALAFFHAVFDPARTDSRNDIISHWADVAKDTHLPSVDSLATKIATL